MFKILDGRESFFQWDLNQKLVIFDESITEVHFCNKTDECALVCEVYKEGNLSIVDVPNILLQQDWPIRVYGVAADHTEHLAQYKVISRSKPADYVYTETEVETFEALEKRMDALEEGATAEIRAQIEQNTADISKQEDRLNNLSTNISQNNVKIATLEANSANYALKTEIPSIEGLASEEYVDNAIANIDLPSGVDGYTLVAEVTLEADVNSAVVSKDINGNPLNIAGECFLEVINPVATSQPDGYATIRGTKGNAGQYATGRWAITNGVAKGYMDIRRIDGKVLINYASSGPYHYNTYIGTWTQLFDIGNITQIEVRGANNNIMMTGCILRLYARG